MARIRIRRNKTASFPDEVLLKGELFYNTITDKLFIGDGVKKISQLTPINTTPVDAVPTQNSTNLITSGAVYTGLAGKQAIINALNKLSAEFISGLATIATTGNYSNLSDIPIFTAGSNMTITKSGNTYTFASTTPSVQYRSTYVNPSTISASPAGQLLAEPYSAIDSTICLRVSTGSTWELLGSVWK